jgi:hypothetical protein
MYDGEDTGFNMLFAEAVTMSTSHPRGIVERGSRHRGTAYAHQDIAISFPMIIFTPTSTMSMITASQRHSAIVTSGQFFGESS